MEAASIYTYHNNNYSAAAGLAVSSTEHRVQFSSPIHSNSCEETLGTALSLAPLKLQATRARNLK